MENLFFIVYIATCQAQQSFGCRSGRAPPPRQAPGTPAYTMVATSHSSEQTSQPCDTKVSIVDSVKVAGKTCTLTGASLTGSPFFPKPGFFSCTTTCKDQCHDHLPQRCLVHATWGSRSCLASMSSCQMRRKFSRAQETNCI